MNGKIIDQCKPTEAICHRKPLHRLILFCRVFVLKTLLSWILIFELMIGSVGVAAEGEPGTNSASALDLQDESVSFTKSTSLASGFLIHIRCDQDTKLNGDYRIAPDGKVHLPYEIALSAAGVRVGDFEKRLTSAYRSYFQETPSFRVIIKQKRYWVEVQGLLKTPGPYLVKESTTLDEILAMAGVRTEDLPHGFARVDSGRRSHWVNMEDYLKGGSEHNLEAWRGGERVLFQLERPEGLLSTGSSKEMDNAPSLRKVQVIGEVKDPGGVSFRQSGDGYYYLLQRGGPTKDADLSQVEVIRTDWNTGEHTPVSLGPVSDIKNVRESDILLVHTERPTPFERTLQNSALVASIVSALALTIVVVRNK